MRQRKSLEDLPLALSTSLDRRPEDVCVVAVIVAELELGNIEGHVLAAHLVERADDAALEDAPEAFNRWSTAGRGIIA